MWNEPLAVPVRMSARFIMGGLLLVLAGCAGAGNQDMPGTGSGYAGIPAAGLQPGADNTETDSPATDPVDLPAALRDIDALEAPADVDNEVFAELKAELARLLKERGNEQGLQADASSGIARYASDTAKRKGKYVPEPFQPRINHEQHTLSWHYILDGDYDQNGVVSGADLVPLAGHLGDVAGNGGLDDYFEIGTVDYVIDRNGDGFITLADLIAIATNFGKVVGPYKAYASEDWRDKPWAPDKQTELSAPGVPPFSTVDLSDAKLSNGGQLYFEIPLSSGDFSYNWITREDEDAIQRSTIAMPGETFGEVRYGVTPFRERETALLYYAEDNSIGMLPILQCDGDGSGQVTIADITPLGIYLGQDVDIPLQIRAYHRADYNMDGIITLYDLQPVGARLAASLEGYYLYYAANAGELPAEYWDIQLNDPILSIDMQQLAFPEEWDFHYIPEQFRELPFTPASGSYLYLRPYLGDELGPVCEFVQVP